MKSSFRKKFKLEMGLESGNKTHICLIRWGHLKVSQRDEKIAFLLKKSLYLARVGAVGNLKGCKFLGLCRGELVPEVL